MEQGPSESVLQRIEGFAQSHHATGYEEGFMDGYRRTKKLIAKRAFISLAVGLLLGGVSVAAAVRAGILQSDTPAPDPIELGMERGLRFKAAVNFAREYTVGVIAKESGRRGFFGNTYAPQHLGSGFIFNDEGYIVTNGHVIGNATEIQIVWKNNEVFNAKLVGSARHLDLAVLKVNASGLKSAALAGPDDEIHQSEEILAIGSPYGLHHTVTAGVVSYVGRQIKSDLTPYIQTDASINKGNSGGPLINLQGRVVGMNTWQISESGDSSGLGFAIPINYVKEAAEAIIAKHGGRFENNEPSPRIGLGEAYLGISTEDTRHGIQIVEVVPDTVAAQEGLRSNDIIQAVDGRPVNSTFDLIHYMQFRRPGDTMKLQILRDNQALTITLNLGRRPSG